MERRAKWLLSVGMALVLIALPMMVAAQLPESKGAPAVGEKAPDFTLPDADGKPVKLADVLAGKDAAGKKPNGVLLVFYRGYW
jgi:cytochrome oxidase Cu insertion factor (SCO1/SenC/PrrC family)